MIERIQAARRALVLGIGGGGDVVGALAVARLCESLGTPFALGGVAWERFAIDPRPGPRPLEEIRGGERLDGVAVLADAATTTETGSRSPRPGWRTSSARPRSSTSRAGSPGPRGELRRPWSVSTATCCWASTSAGTCWGTATRTGSRARFATP